MKKKPNLKYINEARKENFLGAFRGGEERGAPPLTVRMLLLLPSEDVWDLGFDHLNSRSRRTNQSRTQVRPNEPATSSF